MKRKLLTSTLALALIMGFAFSSGETAKVTDSVRPCAVFDYTLENF